MHHLENLLAFVDLTHRFQQTKRVIHAFNKEKLLQYALVHDLVEAYAGDTYFYRDAAADQKKKEAEHAAAQRIAREFPDFPALHTTIAAYEEQNDPESKLLYSLDKLLPVINIYRDGGRAWRRLGVTYEMTSIEKTKKITDPLITQYLTELRSLLKDQQDLFAQPPPHSK